MMGTSLRLGSALKSLPPFPPVAAKLITLMAGDSVSLRQLADILKTDAALSAEVLRLANSPLFRRRSEIGNILQAMSFLGLGRLTGLMLTLSMSKVLKAARSNEMIRRAWRHNLASALASQGFAQSFGRDADEGYNAGLFHDVGRLAFMVAEPVLYEGLVRRGGDMLQLEREHFGADHCEAGAALLELWKLPRVFAEAARHHHAPTSESSELVMLVNASCAVSNRLGFSVADCELDELDTAGDGKLALSITETIGVLEREYGIGT